jgi:hypothetical protein
LDRRKKMGTNINISVYVDAYLTPEGVGIYVASEGDGSKEITIPYRKLVEEYLEMYQVPSDPPTMHDEDRENITNLCNSILSALDHLRKLEHDTPTYTYDMGHRD